MSDLKNLSVECLMKANKDPLLTTKLQFFLAVSMMVTPFLTRYQCDEPALPYMAADLHDLLKNLLRRFIKREHLDSNETPEKLRKIVVTDKEILVHPKNVDIGFAAEAMSKKLLDKSPVKYSLVRNMSCLDSRNMVKHHGVLNK